MKPEFLEIFDTISNIKFHQNPPSRSGVVPCTGTDMTKLIVAFRNFANAPNDGFANLRFGNGTGPT
jgi:hypothetical protein